MCVWLCMQCAVIGWVGELKLIDPHMSMDLGGLATFWDRNPTLLTVKKPRSKCDSSVYPIKLIVYPIKPNPT
jgi:hypothetical protein